MDLTAIQKALRERNIDAWLFYDHHHRDPIAYRVLGLPAGLMVTRRWFYLIPAKGEPSKLVHKIEAGHLDTLPGTKRLYSGWQELFDGMKGFLASHRDIAMQYSPNNLVFTISLVDAGTVDLIRGLGKNVVSSQDLVAQFEATMNDDQIATHYAARDVIDGLTAEAFQEIGRRVRKGGTFEHEIQQWFMDAFEKENLVTDDPPIVAVNANSMVNRIQESAKKVRAPYDVTAAAIQKNYHAHLSALERAFTPIVKEPTYQMWNDGHIMTLARNLNQQIGNVENLVQKGYDIGMDAAACSKFFKDMNLYARQGVPFKMDAPEPERKEHVKEMLKLLIRARALK